MVVVFVERRVMGELTVRGAVVSAMDTDQAVGLGLVVVWIQTG